MHKNEYIYIYIGSVSIFIVTVKCCILFLINVKNKYMGNRERNHKIVLGIALKYSVNYGGFMDSKHQ